MDRAALDAALDHRFPCGGFCPRGRIAEDGTIDRKYPLQEHASKLYKNRTLENILQSDGTLIIYSQILKGGTALTHQICKQYNKPHISLNAYQVNPDDAAKLTLDFIHNNQLRKLNVAGPRRSQWPDGYVFAYRCIEQILGLCYNR